MDDLARQRSISRKREGGMKKRNRTKQEDVLEVRLALEAARLREQAKSLQPGPEREQLLRKARQPETGSRMSEWLRSPGLQPPK